MNVRKTRDIDRALRMLDHDERQVASAWIERLKNWDHDEQLRETTRPTGYQDIYALNTPDDLRLFFTLDAAKAEIVIVDFSRPSRFEAAGATSE